jgi:hypothetical protein
LSPLRVVAGETKDVRRPVVKRYLARTVHHREEQRTRMAVGYVANHNLVRARAAGHYCVDVLELGQAPELGGEDAELKDLRATRDELHAAAGDGGGGDAILRPAPAALGAALDQRQLGAGELGASERAVDADAIHDHADADRRFDLAAGRGQQRKRGDHPGDRPLHGARTHAR